MARCTKRAPFQHELRPRALCQCQADLPLTFASDVRRVQQWLLSAWGQTKRTRACARLAAAQTGFAQSRQSGAHTNTFVCGLTWRSTARAWRHSPPSTSSWSAASPLCAASRPTPSPGYPPPDTCQMSATLFSQRAGSQRIRLCLSSCRTLSVTARSKYYVTFVSFYISKS